MGNLKQRYIKAGRDYNYAEGVKVKATTAVYADQIVYVTASDGPYLTVSPADADETGTTAPNGRLMIAKHDIPINGYGVVLPWKLVTTLSTVGSAVGRPVFLADSVTGAAAGNLTLTVPTGVTKIIVVGRVTIVGAAGTGAILVNAAAPEERVQAGAVSASAATVGRPLEQLKIVTAASTDPIDVTLPYGILITDVHAISAGSASDQAVGYKGETTDAIFGAFAFGGSDHDLTRCSVINRGYSAIPAGTAIRTLKSGVGNAGDIIIYTFIRA